MWPSLLPSPSLPWASTQAPYHTPYVHSDHSTHTHNTVTSYSHILPVHTLYTSKSKQSLLLTLLHCLTYQHAYIFMCLTCKLIECRRKVGGREWHGSRLCRVSAKSLSPTILSTLYLRGRLFCSVRIETLIVSSVACFSLWTHQPSA